MEIYDLIAVIGAISLFAILMYMVYKLYTISNKYSFKE